MEDAVTICLEEFKALRAEIVERVKNQLNLITANVTLTGLAVGSLGLISKQKLLVFLAIPLLSIFFGVAYLGQEIGILTAARYIYHQLRPAIESRLTLTPEIEGGTSGVAIQILAWDRFHSIDIVQGSASIKLVSRLAGFTSVLPGLAAWVGAVVLLLLGAIPFDHMRIEEWALFVAFPIFGVGVMAIWVAVLRRYSDFSN